MESYMICAMCIIYLRSWVDLEGPFMFGDVVCSSFKVTTLKVSVFFTLLVSMCVFYIVLGETLFGYMCTVCARQQLLMVLCVHYVLGDPYCWAYVSAIC